MSEPTQPEGAIRQFHISKVNNGYVIQTRIQKNVKSKIRSETFVVTRLGIITGMIKEFFK